MKIKIKQYKNNNYWSYCIEESEYKQKEYDYVFKYLDFEKLDKNEWILFDNNEIECSFHEIYTNIHLIENIYNQSPEVYQYLKDNWCKGLFKINIYYQDKQELKTIVNKVINIELIGWEL